MMNYQDCVDYILSIPLFAVKLGTENLNRILDVMGHPERTAPVIHVAGTNGKGSTCSFLSSILTAKGFKTGVFTSPHLININERIRIGTEEISNDDFVAVFEEVMRVVKVVEEDGMAHPSFFEFMFLMAAVYFKKQDVDYAIYETGMGGRLDATNVVKPELCIITSVGMDHMQFLGDTIEQIAEEKAGIIKQGVPVVYFHRNFTVKDIIEKYCKKMGAVLHIVEKTQYN
ncbi:MAG: bifunctional folylpolyglutamate synthase/dihydrofolate synthase, partial [Lachnospiraceae bacterium]|nr:bifunctional folylpolyglutamate synthase/dihydrofolate synthase [Lachnospiraceae bacterium]